MPGRRIPLAQITKPHNPVPSYYIPARQLYNVSIDNVLLQKFERVLSNLDENEGKKPNYMGLQRGRQGKAK